MVTYSTNVPRAETPHDSANDATLEQRGHLPKNSATEFHIAQFFASQLAGSLVRQNNTMQKKHLVQNRLRHEQGHGATLLMVDHLD